MSTSTPFDEGRLPEIAVYTSNAGGSEMANSPIARIWFPHLDFAGEPMREGQFREPYPMQEENDRLSTPAVREAEGERL